MSARRRFTGAAVAAMAALAAGNTAVPSAWAASAHHQGGGVSVTNPGTQISGTFAGVAAWLAGYTSQGSARTACSSTSFTGGRVTYTQYSSGGLDADFPC